MSGFLEKRASVRRQRLMIVACAATVVVAATLIWRQGGKHVAEPVAVPIAQATCIAIAIDRDTGLATQEPCAASRVLVAVQGDPR